ncbi:MAG TPA: hypothetical protein VFN03_01760 [Trueperaceae bacterium]|nr:hypothetical protein [Trueperaceae bacterium]
MQFWTAYLSSLPEDTILDARSCAGGFDAGEVAHRDPSDRLATLSRNVVFLAKKFDLSHRNLAPADSSSPAKVWFVVEDVPGACSNGNGIIDNTAQGSKVTVTALAYTPCTAVLANGAGAVWTGSIYVKRWEPQGTLVLDLKPIGFPGIRDWSGTPVNTKTTIIWGELISQRDLP